MTGWRIGADVGGTFTDVVAIGPDGTHAAVKVHSTPDDYSRGIAEGVAAIMARCGIPADAVGLLAHGTTVVTNTILERRGGPTALITTRGFRDVLELGRMRVPRLYDMLWVKPEPLVARQFRFEVDERLDPTGAVVTPLDEAGVEAIAGELDRHGIRSVAICLLHSYADGTHERRLAELLTTRLPGLDISLSHEVLARPGEYERTSTTVVNAYVRPAVREYFAGVAARLSGAGLRVPVHVMQSDGGLVGLATAGELPVTVIESGPAAGVVAAQRVAGDLGVARALSFDMGGTTAKACLVEDGRVVMAEEFAVGAELSVGSRVFSGGGFAVRAPALDIAEVGAGGGSLLRVDEGGLLRVGPRSAGARPGPVAYGRGGTEPTITDAGLVLGYLDDIADGTVTLDRAAAEDAIRDRIAAPLELTVDEAASGARRIATTTMARTLKAVSTERGHDPRDFTLIAFGGNGPGYACDIAEELGIRTVLVPPLAGVFSAVGLATAPVRRAFLRSTIRALDDIAVGALDPVVDVLRAEAADWVALEAPSTGGATTEVEVDLRYTGQSTDLPVRFAAGVTAADLGESFQESYERIFGLRFDLPLEIAAVRLVATLATDLPQATDGPAGSAAGERPPVGKRSVHFGSRHGRLMTEILDEVADLGDGRSGPLILRRPDTTVVIAPGWRAAPAGAGVIRMERES
ncbi:hydantoinase/oxoprolinase family protein [Nakamurella sp. YIM 132087]|uniref:Hydantoinase/oxoprolinase family protein n=1 Tax=Nakamurella alba TaxID=2665158 RepID=A0A7K1FQ61_9ACTN|nr:hydantoinase/oxoprolinase family protein [Nakamurella alba]MTD16277.1 hydantoinase/oxoprolinase family protein [Nakamurella alba]